MIKEIPESRRAFFLFLLSSEASFQNSAYLDSVFRSGGLNQFEEEGLSDKRITKYKF